ncbi:hypothetical protein N0824_02880 [Microcystis sp. 0824]|nr:hypothetical protein N0824_02880 [Microcystis sp. 0824]
MQSAFYPRRDAIVPSLAQKAIAMNKKLLLPKTIAGTVGLALGNAP